MLTRARAVASEPIEACAARSGCTRRASGNSRQLEGELPCGSTAQRPSTVCVISGDTRRRPGRTRSLRPGRRLPHSVAGDSITVWPQVVSLLWAAAGGFREASVFIVSRASLVSSSAAAFRFRAAILWMPRLRNRRERSEAHASRVTESPVFWCDPRKGRCSAGEQPDHPTV